MLINIYVHTQLPLGLQQPRAKAANNFLMILHGSFWFDKKGVNKLILTNSRAVQRFKLFCTIYEYRNFIGDKA